MRYYLENYPKTNFYMIGELKSDGKFYKSHGYEFIKEYLSEFPYLSLDLMVEMHTTWGVEGKIKLIKLLNKIK